MMAPASGASGVVIRTGWVDPRTDGGRNFGNNNLAVRVIRMYIYALTHQKYMRMYLVHTACTLLARTHMLSSLSSQFNAYSHARIAMSYRSNHSNSMAATNNPPFHYKTHCDDEDDDYNQLCGFVVN